MVEDGGDGQVFARVCVCVCVNVNIHTISPSHANTHPYTHSHKHTPSHLQSRIIAQKEDNRERCRPGLASPGHSTLV
jgi:hypothetical protein